VADLDLALREFDEHYGMTSEEFRRRWRARELDHSDFDLNRWAGFLWARDRTAGIA
jgi:hypothetical protein